MLKVFDQYQKVRPILIIYQACLGIVILWTCIGLIIPILNMLSLIPSQFLKEGWMTLFLPDIHMTLGSIIFPVVLQSQYTAQILLYFSLSSLPILILLYYSSFQLKTIFENFEVENEAFTKVNSISFKNIGIAIVFTVIIQFAIDFGYGAFLSLIINTYERSSSEWTGIFINAPMIFSGILAASIFFGLASMFSKGVELKEDNDSII
ncbi:MAG: hypothetical protein JJE17_02995 [Peptostreptococcaceae bacterium]|nr:hypothetical protein [Peptostreptococcaceae bacterium]